MTIPFGHVKCKSIYLVEEDCKNKRDKQVFNNDNEIKNNTRSSIKLKSRV